MRHIKYKATLNNDMTYAFINIIEQTHTGESLTPRGEIYRNRITGFIIRSCSCPAWEGDEDTVWLRGHNSRLDNSVIRLPIKLYPKFKSTVQAYNEEFK